MRGVVGGGGPEGWGSEPRRPGGRIEWSVPGVWLKQRVRGRRLVRLLFLHVTPVRESAEGVLGLLRSPLMAVLSRRAHQLFLQTGRPGMAAFTPLLLCQGGGRGRTAWASQGGQGQVQLQRAAARHRLSRHAT